MGFVDDDEVKVAPNEAFEVDVTDGSAVAGEVGVMKDFVAEVVVSEDVAVGIGSVERPVFAQAFGAKD